MRVGRVEKLILKWLTHFMQTKEFARKYYRPPSKKTTTGRYNLWGRQSRYVSAWLGGDNWVPLAAVRDKVFKSEDDIQAEPTERASFSRAVRTLKAKGLIKTRKGGEKYITHAMITPKVLTLSIMSKC